MTSLKGHTATVVSSVWVDMGLIEVWNSVKGVVDSLKRGRESEKSAERVLVKGGLRSASFGNLLHAIELVSYVLRVT